MFGISILVQKLSSTVRYIPYNMSLNMLPKRNKYETPFNLSCLYLCFKFLLAVEEPASLVVLYENSTMDSICFILLFDAIKLNLLLIWNAIYVGTLIIIHHKKIFNPLFDNFELSATWIFSLLLILSSDVHPNPGPYRENSFSTGFLSFCNWNLNTLSKDNFYRISLLEAHNTIFKYDIISLCETSLDDKTPVPENALPGYLFHPLNNPTGEKNGGVGIFYKESLPLKVREDLSFSECLVSELKFGHKKIFFTVFYRNPKHQASSAEFENFLAMFENLQNV